MIGPILSLAFSMQSMKGGYAVLLGSGVSRPASVPTGWDMVLDLIRELAHLRGEDCDPDPEQWYRTVFRADADYSRLLQDLGKTRTERQQLLRRYFEATEEEAEQGIKQPTRAHKAIAQLVRSEHIRIIITTNFDKLCETSLRQIGIEPTVISTPSEIEGAVPYIHEKCTIIKVSGD
jgi:hypothetical protein